MIYYDYFAEQYVTEKDVSAPPERYLTYMKGTEGIYTEKYSVYVNGDPSFCLDFSYTEFERVNHPQMVALRRKNHFEVNNRKQKNATLIAYIIPPSGYNRILEEWKLKEN